MTAPTGGEAYKETRAGRQRKNMGNLMDGWNGKMGQRLVRSSRICLHGSGGTGWRLCLP